MQVYGTCKKSPFLLQINLRVFVTTTGTRVIQRVTTVSACVAQPVTMASAFVAQRVITANICVAQ